MVDLRPAFEGGLTAQSLEHPEMTAETLQALEHLDRGELERAGELLAHHQDAELWRIAYGPR